MRAKDRIYCAFDTPSLTRALEFASLFRGHIGGAKVGLEFFAAQGPEGVRSIVQTGLPVFLDLKLHDIPNTVARAVSSLVELEPAMLTLHTLGGEAMLKAAADVARDEAEKQSVSCPRLLGVTVLTSLNQDDLKSIGVADSTGDQVKRLAELAVKSGLDGVVCSPHEIETLRKAFGRDLLLVVPGIRPEGAEKGDQKRVMTPPEAIKKGADHLVIGRPITEAPVPLNAARSIVKSLQS